ncbi:MAG: Ig-like domain-containing protein [Lachnospiraceae bacterium]|nr:Ig-like domain-containing protein [Agathobacter sp.]MDD6290730.1 Ig-like domain-containing protein [Lachnospiraceae bacterium]
MKTKVSKKIGSLVLALAIAFTAVFATVTPVEAATTDYKSLYASPEMGEEGYANTEVRIHFTVPSEGKVWFLIQTLAPCEMKLALYNSAGNLVADDYLGNPYTVSAYDSNWYANSYGYAEYDETWNLAAGDYTYGITFTEDTPFLLDVIEEGTKATISQTKATITKGFTKKLSVSGGTVKSWSSNKKSVATVDKKGKVTAKKAGKATITATLTDGTKLKCNVTVKDNKYSASKITTSDVYYGKCAMSAYSASFDTKGNLVVKTKFVNNDYYKVVALKNIKIVVKDGNGKTVGTYKASKKNVTVSSGSTKDITFTIKKSSLKKKKADLRNCTITCDGIYEYYY